MKFILKSRRSDLPHRQWCFGSGEVALTKNKPGLLFIRGNRGQAFDSSICLRSVRLGPRSSSQLQHSTDLGGSLHHAGLSRETRQIVSNTHNTAITRTTASKL